MTTATISEAEERKWWKEHPEPQVIRTPDKLTLWNYPVAGTELAEQHASALKFFLQNLWFGLPVPPRTSVSICGHASATGEAASNETYARERADKAARYVRSLGLEALETGAMGSSKPLDDALNGQALARNRRVEVTLYSATIEPPQRTPEPIPAPPRGSPPAPKPSGSEAYFEWEGDLEVADLEQGFVAARFSLVGTFTFKVSRGDPGWAKGFVLSKDGITPEFSAKLSEKVEASITVKPPEAGKKPSVEVTLEGKVWGFPVEAGFQPDRLFWKVEVTLGTMPLRDIELERATLSIQFEGKIRGEFGPSRALLRQLFGSEAAAGAALLEGAAALGVVAVFAVIIGGTIYASEEAGRKMTATALDAATRDGVAAEVAYHALDLDPIASEALKAHGKELLKYGKADAETSFRDGRQRLRDHLDALTKEPGDRRTETINAWKEKYAKGKNATDFDVIREDIMNNHLSAYTNDPRPLAELIPTL
jgi:hypothetical protein